MRGVSTAALAASAARMGELDGSPPALSVILPVYEAMPYLTIAVRDVLRQRLAGDAALELVCAWDGGAEDSWEFLAALAAALPRGERLADVVGDVADGGGGDGADDAGGPRNPADAAAERHDGGVDHPAVARVPCDALSVAEVVAAARPEHALRVVRRADGANRGQGDAMTIALRNCRAPLVAQMEADDRRPNDGAYAAMIAALEARGWDGVCSTATPFGSPSPRMASYCEWQNGLLEPTDLAAARFIEIPALHQTALFTRAAIDAVLGPAGRYRDGRADGDETPYGRLDAPVDLAWWLAFFAKGLVCGRIPAARAAPSNSAGGLADAAHFGWRQHPRQRTRVHGRLSVENLRAVKAAALRAAHPSTANVLLTSVGKTLEGWRAELEVGDDAPAAIKTVEWRPSKRTPPPECPPSLLRTDRPPGVLRVWAYGDANARRRVRLHVPDWDDALDVFVA